MDQLTQFQLSVIPMSPGLSPVKIDDFGPQFVSTRLEVFSPSFIELFWQPLQGAFPASFPLIDCSANRSFFAYERIPGDK